MRDEQTKNFIEEKYSPFSEVNIPIVSVVTHGEIESLALRNKWGEKRKKAVAKFFEKCVTTDINSRDVIKKYGEIDTFSQGKLKKLPLGQTSRNMGKNDLWIAATAAVTNSTLLTSDKDFNHLNKIYFDLQLIKLVR